MTAGPLGDNGDGGPPPTAPGRRRRKRAADDRSPDPSAGMVLHRVLALSARTFLLNDLDDGSDDGTAPGDTVDALALALRPRPLWAQSTAASLRGSERRDDSTERIHQSRVAMRRIRSNLRTFRLLLDPGRGTALRAELAWYGNELGRSRDLDLLAGVVATRGPEVLEPDEVVRLLSVLDWRREAVDSEIALERSGPRRLQLTGRILELWEGPEFKAKAARPASEVLPPMLHRAWHDLRGAARRARKDPSAVHLHRLRIRLKDLRYGSETLALVEGGPARKTAKATERLQSRLGDLHDTVFAIGWLESLAADQAELADAAGRMVALQREVAAETRRGWRRDLKEVERRWRRWQG